MFNLAFFMFSVKYLRLDDLFDSLKINYIQIYRQPLSKLFIIVPIGSSLEYMSKKMDIFSLFLNDNYERNLRVDNVLSD